MRWILNSLLFLLFRSSHQDNNSTVAVCDPSNSNNSYIYCNGPILKAVNDMGLYNDSKTFVDMPMLQDPAMVLSAFSSVFGNNSNSNNMSKVRLQTFIDQYFSAPGSELVVCTPSDWKPNPPKLATIQDPKLRDWALQLNNIWKDLCRQVNTTILDHSSRYSLLYVPHPFIVPGGRFREFYYWDAYWIIKGLIACDMYDSTKNMIRNLASVIDRYGFVPNGGRVYYLQRSQPPFLSGMVYELFEATGDVAFVVEMLPTLVKELNFWDANRRIDIVINGTTHQIYQYKTPSNVPRPESYSVDTKNAASMTPAAQAQFWQDIASSAESGWDFSTRWFADKKTLTQIETTKILPVDLNAVVCWNLDILEYLYERAGDQATANIYRSRRAVFRDSFYQVFYNETQGTWFDYNLRTKLHNTEFYPSIAVPLFTNCFNTLNTGKSERLFGYMKTHGVFDYPSGIPTSMIKGSGEQWDFPNGWSPSNHMIIEGLRKNANPEMQDQGFQLASKWVLGNYRVFQETGHMWEKYNVTGTYPQPGSGGEYNVQNGFGWTNGAILDLLVTYNDRLAVSPPEGSSAASKLVIPTAIIALVSILARCI
ncbi:unnamed protein product [Caenorhabditis auriculariae]|uniref:Trehalase n=1 Tax=Caenorhabditis auriculariae TaxID=2777116 RepID=A0A8S1H0F3_9PELO|nr:unnamed protein product [Caenorhabditis auriculariae]